MKRQDIDRLVDERVALNAYFHASPSELPIGAELTSWQFADSGSLVDTLRPPGVARRRDHFFMVRGIDCLPSLGQNNPDQTVYEVQPTDDVIRANYGWIDDIFQIAADDENYEKSPLARRAAYAYWAGKPKPGKPCLTEYLTRSFVPKREVGQLGDLLAERGAPLE